MTSLTVFIVIKPTVDCTVVAGTAYPIHGKLGFLQRVAQSVGAKHYVN